MEREHTELGHKALAVQSPESGVDSRKARASEARDSELGHKALAVQSPESRVGSRQ